MIDFFNVCSFVKHQRLLAYVDLICGDDVGPATETINHQGFTAVREVFPECFLCII
jgi:hypothetical protein